MKILTRSKNTVLAQLSALREAIDDEPARRLPNEQKIQELKIRFAECAEELAELEIGEWRKKHPFVF